MSFFTRRIQLDPAQMRDENRAKYDGLIASGAYRPFLWPWDTLGIAIMFLYLLFPVRFLGRYGNYIALICVTIPAVDQILHCKARETAAGFGVGLMVSWTIIWSWTMLGLDDPIKKFKRIERRPDKEEKEMSVVEGNGHAGGDYEHENGRHVPRKRTNGRIILPEGADYSTAGPHERSGSFFWQAFPASPLIERLDYVADFFTSFRGLGWNWQISGLAPLPKYVEEQLRENSDTEVSASRSPIGKDGTRRYYTRKDLMRAKIWLFIVFYLALDLEKALTVHDEYFLTGDHSRAPPNYLPEWFRASPVLIRSYRLLTCEMIILSALQEIFVLAPLFFVGILGPKYIGARGEPWMYPDTFGSFSNIFDRGLAGWWGGWWHQTFRFAFQAPSKAIVTKLGMDSKSSSAKALQLVLAFALSGCIHASGSTTQLNATRPFRGPFLFFLLQPFGIMAQVAVSGLLKKMGISQRIPKRVRQLVNFVYTHAWLYHTAGLLVDDFARGGLWLLEPIPFSVFRLLGFGQENEGWWCWGGSWAKWHQGKHWWSTGLAA